MSKLDGFSASFYVKRHDTDFVEAVMEWCKKNELSFSNIVVTALKGYLLDSGTLFNDFKETLAEKVDYNLDNTFIIYRGRRRKLKDVINDEFVVNDARVKI